MEWILFNIIRVTLFFVFMSSRNESLEIEERSALSANNSNKFKNSFTNFWFFNIRIYRFFIFWSLYFNIKVHFVNWVNEYFVERIIFMKFNHLLQVFHIKETELTLFMFKTWGFNSDLTLMYLGNFSLN